MSLWFDRIMREYRKSPTAAFPAWLHLLSGFAIMRQTKTGKHMMAFAERDLWEKMWTFGDLLNNFFTHRDFLPPAQQLPGTLFTPLHIGFAAVCALLVALGCRYFSRKGETTRRVMYGAVWAVVTVLELVKILWETCAGAVVAVNWVGILPLYPCSIFMYAMPFAVWGRGLVRRAAQGYVCTLGLLGGLINFVYPANILGTYSCISFAGMHTFVYHGTIVLCALTMLLSGDHRYTGITKWWELLLPAVPFLAVSVVANAVNFSPINADYMFFKLESFIFAPIGAALPHVAAVLLTYAAYLLIHALPYIPAYAASRKKS